jgi:large subunit ribosomal protein L24
MAKYHVKKGDTVLVIAGEFKGKQAKIAAILEKKQRVVLDGLSSGRMRTVKRRAQGEPGFIERAVSTHISNVKKIDAATQEDKNSEAPEAGTKTEKEKVNESSK